MKIMVFRFGSTTQKNMRHERKNSWKNIKTNVKKTKSSSYWLFSMEKDAAFKVFAKPLRSLMLA